MVAVSRLLALVFVVLGLPGLAQVSFQSPEELEKAANELFASKEYTKAKPLFSQLLSNNALDPNFNYRFGVCIMFTEADPLKPLPYIEGGANSKGVNSEAFYYLGKAYQFNYRFNDAITAYQKAVKAGFKGDGIDLDKSIAECRNGNILYNAAISFEPAQDKEVIASEFYRPYDFRRLKGKVIPMPPTFKTKYDEKNLLGTVIYTPTSSEVLVFASYGESGANGKDLYRVNRLPNGEWAIPQPLPNNINTKYDEDYAFFDEESQVLYFASKGHNTMGGFDVFKTKLDPETNQWSTPINLQYPINSPFDDFLYVSDPEGKLAFFTSSRNTEEGKLRVLKILLHDPLQVEVSVVDGVFEDKTDSVYNYMAATVIDPLTNEVVGKYRSHKETGKYLLILPPQNDYIMDVGPKEADGFRFDLDVPKQESVQALKQSISYDSSNDKGTVTLTNYFDAAGKPDSVEFAASKPISEIEEKMVAMPDASLILAARKKEKEEAQLAIAQAEKAEKEAAEKRRQEELAIEAAKLAKEKEEADQARLAEAKKQEERLAAETAKRDSLAAVELALSQEKKQEEAKQKAKEDSLQVALNRELEATQKAQALEAAAQAKIEATRRDSIAAVELAIAAKQQETLKAEKATRDSLDREEQRLAAQKIEAERLAKIDEEVELTKQKALRDSADVGAVTQAEDESLSDLLKEMEAQEAELLGVQSVAIEQVAKEQTEKAETTDETVDAEIADSDVNEKVVDDSADLAEANADAAIEQKVEETTEEPVSESDLFLQTIAKLEQQKEEQQQLIDEENATLKQEKATASDQVVEPSGVQLSEADGTVSSTGSQALAGNDSTVVADAVNADVPKEVAVLKSDAKPQDYLAALNEIEKEIEKDKAARKDKSYELTSIEGRAAGKGAEVDPVLQAKIDADRLALAEHRQKAEEKERALNEQMQADRNAIAGVADRKLSDEILLMEQEMVNETETVSAAVETVEPEPVVIEKPESTPKEVVEATESTDAAIEAEIAEFEKILARSTNDEVAEVEEPASVESEEIAVEEIEPETAEVEVTEEENEVLEELAELDAIESIKDDEVETVVEAQPEPVVLEEEIVDEEETVEVEVAQNQPQTDDSIAEDIELLDELAEMDEVNVADEQPEITESLAEGPRTVESTVGTIPFLTAARRNYATTKPSFEKIEDSGMRRMIKRMRAEDVGRMAVMKNIKNEKIDAAGDQQALKEIQQNLRNQDVLATTASSGSREEYVRPPFDRNHLRKRQDVYYKLEFTVTTKGISETVSEAMKPELAIAFAMPTIELQSSYFQTLADAMSGYNEYKGRGFDSVQIVPYLKNEKVTLSDVQGVPFVD